MRRIHSVGTLAGSMLAALPLVFWVASGWATPTDDGDTRYFIGLGHEQALRAVFVGQGGEDPFSPYAVRSISIHQTRIEVVFAQTTGHTTRITLVHPDADPANPLRTPVFAIQAGDGENGDVLARRVHERLATASFTNLWQRSAAPTPRPPPEFQVDRVLAWAWLALGLLILWLGLRPLPARPWALALAALAVASGLLRLSFGAISPGNPAILHSPYGYGQAALLLGLPLNLTVDIVLRVAQLLGALAPVFLALAIHARTGDRRLAMVAGVLLAIQPLLVRQSSDFTSQSYVLFLGAVSLWALARWLARPSAVALALYAVAALLCIETRPEAVLILPITALFAWPGHPWRRATLAIAAVQVPLAVVAILRFPTSTMGDSVFDIHRLDLTALFLDTNYTAIVVQGLFLAGLVLGAWRRDRTVLAVAAGLLLVQLAMADRSPDGPNLLFARFRTLGFLPFAFVAAWGLCRVVDTFRDTRVRITAAVLAWILVGISTVGPFRQIVAPRTLDLEFQYLVRTIPELPRGAEIYFPYTDRDMGFRSFPVLSHLVGRPDLVWKAWPPDSSPQAGPRFFYLQSLCNASPDGPLGGPRALAPTGDLQDEDARDFEEVCDEALRHASGPLILEAPLQTRSFHQETYRGQAVRVGYLPIAVPAKSQGQAPP